MIYLREEAQFMNLEIRSVHRIVDVMVTFDFECTHFQNVLHIWQSWTTKYKYTVTGQIIMCLFNKTMMNEHVCSYLSNRCSPILPLIFPTWGAMHVGYQYNEYFVHPMHISFPYMYQSILKK